MLNQKRDLFFGTNIVFGSKKSTRISHRPAVRDLVKSLSGISEIRSLTKGFCQNGAMFEKKAEFWPTDILTLILDCHIFSPHRHHRNVGFRISLMRNFKTLQRDTKAAALIEYIILASLVGVVAIAAVVALGERIKSVLEQSVDSLENPTSEIYTHSVPTHVSIIVALDSSVLPDAEEGEVYGGVDFAQLASVSGGSVDDLNWSITSGTLPAGMSIDSQDGSFGGTPTQIGSFTFTVQAELGAETATNTYTLTVIEQISIALDSATLPDAEEGEVYGGFDFASLASVSGGSAGDLNWSITSGELPSGMNLDAQNGLLGGTPTEIGLFAFTVQADLGGEITNNTYTLIVNDPTGSLEIVGG